MLDQVQKLYEKLLSELEVLDENHKPDLYIPDQRLLLITELMDWLKQNLPLHVFDSDADEMCFFKTALPNILSPLIYYTEKSGLEINELIGTRKSRADYISRLTKRIDDFSAENSGFYDYYSLRKSNFDGYYFLRCSPLNREPVILLGSVVDPRFCPAYSIKVAMISAYRRLDEWCSEQAADKKTEESVAGFLVKRLNWSGTKRGLTELAYSVQKYVNDGQASIKEIVQGFQSLFNTDLGNYPRVFQEILGRKKGDTLFLTQLINDLQKRIEDHEKERLRKRGFK
jgi:succinate dehydrogenase flavin-adding protein (antitoxin of CptAB toxin-antitoxin module)